MTKLNLKTLAGALALVAIPTLATADTRRELGTAQGFTIAPASMTTDLAETRTIDTPQGPVQVLRYNDQDQTQEMAAIKVSPDGRRALYVHMRTAPINEGTAMQSSPNNNMQCALSVLNIGVDATGGFTVARPATGPGQYDTWITDNNGNEWRNCNRPALFTTNGGKNVAFAFNYQPNNSNDTKRYFKILDWDGNIVPITDGNGNPATQVVIEAKNNDDCGTSQDAMDGDAYYDVGGMTRFAFWGGCNGAGTDDGWLFAAQTNCTGSGAASDTTCQVSRLFDISLATREERTRGRCTIGGSDLSFAVCTWTEGNDQPADEGVWEAAVDLSADGQNGENADSRLLWKDRIAYREEMLVNGEPREYYAMRANHARILQLQPDGTVRPSNQILYTWGLNRGGNNNEKKGGRTDYVIAAVHETTRAGYSEVMPKTNIQPLLLGLDNTHVSMQQAIFGKGDTVLPGFTFVMGDHTGGGARNSELRTIAYNPVTHAMENLGQHDLQRAHDRHLYSNYLGNDPGNSGRNFATCDLVKNAYSEMAGNHVTYFQACALTGKLPEMSDSMYKTSALLSIFPVAFTEEAPPPGGGWDEEQLPGEDDPTQGGDNPPGTSVGGCNTSSGSNGLLFALALGLTILIPRRRRA